MILASLNGIATSFLYTCPSGSCSGRPEKTRERPTAHSDTARVASWVASEEAKTSQQLSAEQRKAVEAAAFENVSVLTGGPGCGKTHTTRTSVQLWLAMGKKVSLKVVFSQFEGNIQTWRVDIALRKGCIICRKWWCSVQSITFMAVLTSSLY